MIHLYIKQCPHCSLKYFGKTIREDVESYSGSGIYWVRHLKEHKVKPITLQVVSFLKEEAAVNFALEFSNKNDIVESKGWANLMPENVVYGFYGKHTEKTKEKMRGKRNPFTEETKHKMSAAQTGQGNNNFKGWYITPWGTFESAEKASRNSPFPIPTTSLIGICKLKRTIKKKNKYNIPVGVPMIDLGYGFIEKRI